MYRIVAVRKPPADNNLDDVNRNMSRWQRRGWLGDREKHICEVEAEPDAMNGIQNMDTSEDREINESPIEVDGDIPTLRELGQIQDDTERYLAEQQRHIRTNVVENWSAVTESTRDLGIVWDYEVEGNTY